MLVVLGATIQVALWASGRNMARNAANGAVVVASLEALIRSTALSFEAADSGYVAYYRHELGPGDELPSVVPVIPNLEERMRGN